MRPTTPKQGLWARPHVRWRAESVALPALSRVALARIGLAVLVLLGVGLRVGTLDQPLVENGHSWRQTQTAWTARLFHEEGIDLLRPQVPVLGPPWILPFEFPLFQAMASVGMTLGLTEEMALRLTGLISFAVTAVMVWHLTRRLIGEGGAAVAVAAFTFSPLGLLWSRTAMIEYLATTGAVAFAWSAVVWRDSGRALAYWTAIAAGILACLVKVTTGVFWVLPFAIIAARGRGRVKPLGLGMAIPPLVAGAAWTRYTDVVKAESPGTAGLTSSGLAEWTFGTLAQRLDPATWGAIGASIVVLAGLAILPVCAVIVLTKARVEPAWLALASTVVIPPLVLTNLYSEHDYYAIAVSPSVAAMVGGSIGILWKQQGRARLIAVELAVIAAVVPVVTFGYWSAMFGPPADPERVLSNAALIEASTEPSDHVAIVGREWNPALFYYADRRGIGLPPGISPQEVNAMRAQGYHVFGCPREGDCSAIP